MPDALADLPPRFLRTPEAARFLGLSGRTLEKHRTYGTGPKYRKIGGRVVYALDDLKAWADLGAKTSTSDPGAGTVFPAKRITGVVTSRGVLWRDGGTDQPRESPFIASCGLGAGWPRLALNYLLMLASKA
jgi:predicted DNA-binding transcriptional regulator AlpA